MESTHDIEKIISYLNLKINNSIIEQVLVQDNSTYFYFKLCDLSNSKICSSIYYFPEEKRIIFCFEDIENIEIIEEYNGNINSILTYIESVLSHDIVRTEEYCRDRLVKRYYEFYHNINGKEERVKLYSVNKLSFFCKLEEKVTRFEPW